MRVLILCCGSTSLDECARVASMESTIVHQPERDMTQMVLRSKEELKAEFEAARKGIDPEVVNRIMAGLPLHGGTEFTEPYRSVRRAWAVYHASMK